MLQLSNSDIGTPSAGMDAIAVSNKVLLLEWFTHPIHLPSQDLLKEAKAMFLTRLLPLGRPKGSTKEALHASLPNPTFVLQPC